MRRKRKEIVIKIPSHWGRRKLIGWTIRDPWSCAQLGEFFRSKKEAIKAYPRIVKEWGRFSKETPKIYPEYEYEGAIMNPCVVGWNEGFVPKKKKKKL